jgi:hypothetical protein
MSMKQTCATATINRDKKFLIWNFMEELLQKHDRAFRINASTVFAIRDFESIRLPIFQLGYQFITETLYEYQDRKGHIQINDGNVALTREGLNGAENDIHNWD